MEKKIKNSSSLQPRPDKVSNELETCLNAAGIGYWKLNLYSLTAERSILHDQIFGYSSLLPVWTFDVFIKHVHPSDRKKVKGLLQASFQNKKSVEFECRIYRADNKQLRWIWVSGQFIIADQSTYMSGLVQDITQRKEAECRLKESEMRWQYALEGANQGVWDWYPPEKIIYFSHTWKCMLGYKDNEIGNK